MHIGDREQKDGTVTVSATWTGPDTTDPSQIIDLNATAAFNSCRIGTTTFNGTANIVLSGPADNPTSVNFSSSSLNVSDSATGDNVTVENFTMNESSTAGGTTITISGKMKSSCLDGWVTIGTNTAIFVPTNADCPIAGEFCDNNVCVYSLVASYTFNDTVSGFVGADYKNTGSNDDFNLTLGISLNPLNIGKKE